MAKLRATLTTLLFSSLVLAGTSEAASGATKQPASYPLGAAKHCKTNYARSLEHHRVNGKSVTFIECVRELSASPVHPASYPLGAAKRCKTNYVRRVHEAVVHKKVVTTIICQYVAPPTSPPPPAPAPTVQAAFDPAFQQSLNWAGFTLTSASGDFTDVSGRWVVPTVKCNLTPNAISYSWVGVGGYQSADGTSTGTLLQSGTSDSCVGGVQTDTAWWEEYPSTPSRLYTFTQFPISVGDEMEGSVFLRGDGSYETELSDLDTGLSAVSIIGVGWQIVTTSSGAPVSEMEGSTAGQTYTGGSSAEWILEDAAPLFGTFNRFADFGSVTFTDLITNQGAFSLTPAQGSVIIRNGILVAAPTDPASDNSFTVNYED